MKKKYQKFPAINQTKIFYDLPINYPYKCLFSTLIKLLKKLHD